MYIKNLYVFEDIWIIHLLGIQFRFKLEVFANNYGFIWNVVLIVRNSEKNNFIQIDWILYENW